MYAGLPVLPTTHKYTHISPEVNIIWEIFGISLLTEG